jgi:NAD(P)H-quinone oxidoreductase subunit 6
MVLITPWQINESGPFVEDTLVAIGKHFFSDYLLPFELASVLLLMAMVGAIILARRDLIPDLPDAKSTATALTLPERPRELTSAPK